MDNGSRGGDRRDQPKRSGRRWEAGQTVVEFALVFPLFLVLLLAIIEFAFAFHASLSMGYASRNAALIAAESGNAPGGDCLILRQVEDDLTAPADRARITSVEVYWSDQAGNKKSGAANVYTRTGTMACTAMDGTPFTLPYKSAAVGYPEITRCNILSGCGGGHTTVDTIGVRITYDYPWHTPLSSLLAWGGGSGWLLERSNAMRMEPVL